MIKTQFKFIVLASIFLSGIFVPAFSLDYTQRSPPVEKILQKYHTRDPNLALRRAVFFNRIDDVAKVIEVYSDTNPLLCGESGRNAFDYALMKKNFAMLPLLANIKTQGKLRLSQIIIKLNNYIALNNCTLSENDKIYIMEAITSLYMTYSQNLVSGHHRDSIEEQLRNLYLSSSLQLANLYSQREDFTKLFPHSLTLIFADHRIDETMLRGLFEKHREDPNQAISYAILLLKNNQEEISAWIFESLLWRKLSTEKFIKFLDVNYAVDSHTPNKTIVLCNRALGYKLLFYLHLDPAYADKAAKIYSQVGCQFEGQKLNKQKVDLPNLTGNEAYAVRNLELLAFYEYYSQNSSGLQPRKVVLNTELEKRLCNMIKTKAKIQKILRAVDDGDYKIAPGVVVKLMNYILRRCSIQLRLREDIKSQQNILKGLVTHFDQNFFNYSKEQRINLFLALSKLSLSKPSYLP